MGKDNVVEFRGREASADLLTELLRTGAQKWTPKFGQPFKCNLPTHPVA